MTIPKLTMVGLCSLCGQWIELAENGRGGLPSHEAGMARTTCKNSGYSSGDTRYRVKTEGEARSLAEFLRDDDGTCLSWHGPVHSLACGDGRECAKERLELARALAVYHLQTIEERTDKERRREIMPSA